MCKSTLFLSLPPADSLRKRPIPKVKSVVLRTLLGISDDIDFRLSINVRDAPPHIRHTIASSLPIPMCVSHPCPRTASAHKEGFDKLIMDPVGASGDTFGRHAPQHL